MTKYKRSQATRRLMSLKATGKKNAFYGKHHTKESLAKISRASKGKNNPMFGKHHTAKSKKLIRLARLRALRAR